MTSLAFTPIKVGDMELPHRVAMAPLTRFRAHADHTPSDLLVEYYAQRASFPGTLLVSEATPIAPQAGGYSNIPGIWNDKQIAGWKKVVDAVHAKGSFVYLQLWAMGRAAQPGVLEKEEGGPYDVVSSSDEAFEGGAKPRALSVEEIGEYVGWYARAAKAFVEQAGGDGVEIHGANGYLIDQFTQNTCNKRTDHYGGSVENRTRFALEVTDAVVAAVGASKTAIRLSPYTDFQGMKMSPADITETFTHLINELKARNLAYLHVVESRAASQASGKEENNEEEKLDFVHDIWAPLPLLVAGGHTEDADAAAAKYENSLVVYGRYFISNPDLVARIKHKVAFRPYDRATFYLPEQAEGYTTYPVEYGPEGKL